MALDIWEHANAFEETLESHGIAYRDAGDRPAFVIDVSEDVQIAAIFSLVDERDSGGQEFIEVEVLSSGLARVGEETRAATLSLLNTLNRRHNAKFYIDQDDDVVCTSSILQEWENSGEHVLEVLRRVARAVNASYAEITRTASGHP